MKYSNSIFAYVYMTLKVSFHQKIPEASDNFLLQTQNLVKSFHIARYIQDISSYLLYSAINYSVKISLK